ncbi:MAG: DUF459 domain-containing protein [Actinomycetota bacterium]
MTTSTPQRTARPAPRRRAMPAGRAFVVIAVCLLVWTMLYAPELRRSAEAAPTGTRRSVSLALLSPMVWVSDHVGLTHVTDAAARAAGRDPNAAVGGIVGGIDVGVDELPDPTGSPKPDKPVVHDTRLRVPTLDHQLRVAVVGDSLAAGIGYFAERVFKPFFVEVYKQGRISTGLARPDFFNWPAQMQQIVDRADPDLVLVMLGENDNQGLLYPDGTLEQDIGTFDWASHYEGRVERFAKIATNGGGHVVWIGLPNERDRGRWDFIQKQNSIFQEVADRLPNVAFYDTWTAFAASDGGYSAYYRDDNKVVQVRADDGVHFNTDGYTLLMDKVAAFATQEFQLDPKTYES